MLAAVLAAALSIVPAAAGQTAHSSIVGGTRIAVTSVPWQVYVAVGSNLACGGSVLDARHVLTAAHCVVPEGQGTPRPASDFTVWAGYDNLTAATTPAGSQQAGVTALRVHPYYEERSKADDVAVLMLGSALSFGPRIQPIALAPVGGAPAPGRRSGSAASAPSRRARCPTASSTARRSARSPTSSAARRRSPTRPRASSASRLGRARPASPTAAAR